MKLILLAMVSLLSLGERGLADDVDQFLKPLLAEKCMRCHGGKEVKGDVNLKAVSTASQFLATPELIEQLIEVIDSNAMPPEDEPQLDEPVRSKLLATLKSMLKEATVGSATKLMPRRLNRFQYNNTIRDLFELNRNIFPLSEKLMTRHVNYLHTDKTVMPATVEVSSEAILNHGGFKDVQPYPKDLRAAHGFDNQANQLTLSPLLLEAYLRLSLSIVNSPDFDASNVGIWKTFFEPPAAGTNVNTEVRQRLAVFLQKAFRAPVEPDSLDRYTQYISSKMDQGLPFTDSMKNGAAAILCSPNFLYRYDVSGSDEAAYQLASRLSYFLWGSAPDNELMQLAKSGELVKQDVLASTIDRMLVDPKIERFLDSFPSQWMQLENLFGVTPDPKLYPQYLLEGASPASVQMVLEPLLLFDAVFVENRPLIDLIKPDFAYRSKFLQTWYSGDLTPSKEFRENVANELRIREEARTSLTQQIAGLEAKQTAITSSIRERLLAIKRNAKDAAKTADSPPQTDLTPYAAWQFDGDLTDSISSLDLTAHGEIKYEHGGVLLQKSFLESPKLPIELKAKTLEVWCSLTDLKQRGGGVMTIQDDQAFDSIVYAERMPNLWISGSEGHRRTQDFTGATVEKQIEPLHLVMVYQEDGTTTFYRNGRPYGETYNKGARTFKKDVSNVLFGLRHRPPGGNRFLSVLIAKAFLYDRALTAEEVAIAGEGKFLWVSDQEVSDAMSPDQQATVLALTKATEDAEQALKKLPRRDPNQPVNVEQEIRNRFNRAFTAKLNSRAFQRVPVDNPRYGGIITNAAMLTMTSAPTRTLPIARGAWMIEVVFNDPPPPPPNDIPPLDEESGPQNLTIREKFAKHRESPDCAGCHARIDPLGFSLENFDIAGRWRDKYENNRDVDATGTLMKKYDFTDIVDLKEVLVKEDKRFAKAFTAHLLRFALARELNPADSLVVDDIVGKTEKDQFRLKSILREVILSDAFLQTGN